MPSGMKRTDVQADLSEFHAAEDNYAASARRQASLRLGERSRDTRVPSGRRPFVPSPQGTSFGAFVRMRQTQRRSPCRCHVGSRGFFVPTTLLPRVLCSSPPMTSIIKTVSGSSTLRSDPRVKKLVANTLRTSRGRFTYLKTS